MKNFSLLVFYFLIVVSPIPNTIAIRLFLSFFLFILLMIDGYRGCLSLGYNLFHDWRKNYLRYYPLLLLLIIAAYIPLHSYIIALDSRYAMSSYIGQWIRPMTLFIVGSLLAIQQRHRPRAVVLTLIIAFSTLVIAHGVNVLYMMWMNEFKVPYRIVNIVGSKDRFGLISNGLLSVIFATLIHDVFQKNINLQIVIRKYRWILWSLICLILLISIQVQARNGWIGVVFLSSSSFMFLLVGRGVKLLSWRFFKYFLIIITLLGLLASVAIKSDTRWEKFFETSKIALDGESYRSWLENPSLTKRVYPKLEDGRVVDESAYLRVSWLMSSFHFVAERPIGYGFSRDVFGRVTRFYYGKNLQSHSHSGIMNWTLALGVFGLIPWVLFIMILLSTSLKTWGKNKAPSSLILFFLVSGFTARSMVDSMMQDHMLEQFLLLAGIFYQMNILSRRD